MSDTERPMDYGDYLKLKQLLELQDPLSFKTPRPAHDEMMYIITHQCFELWFKLIIHELRSVISILGKPYVADREIGTSVARLRRVNQIQDLVLQQFKVLETLTPLDYLDWRGLLSTASGFQSYQFRVIENLMGLPSSQRLTYADLPYYACFREEQQRELKALELGNTLFSVLDRWLARTPFLDLPEFKFLDWYESAVKRMLGDEQPFSGSYIKGKGESQGSLSKVATQAFYTREQYQQLREKGEKRLAWEAALAVLFISLFRDEPILHAPYLLLETVIDLDERFALWRYTHTLVVHKMLGKRPGTAGSSGFDYLRQTVERHRVFAELFDSATLLIPRSELPALPPALKNKLDFYYSAKS